MAYNRYYKKKNNVGAVIGGTIAFLLLLGLIGGVAYKSEGFRNWNVKDWFSTEKTEKDDEDKKDSSSDVQTSVTNSTNMAIRMLAKTENQDGSISLTYSYTITPNNATRKGVTGALSWVDNQVQDSIGSYLEFSVDSSLQTFTITKKADFNHQAQLVLTCDSAQDVNATITIDCKQVFNGFNQASQKSYSQILTAQNDIVLNTIKSDLAHEVGADNKSSIYTIALNDNYTIQSVSYQLTGYMMGDSINAMVSSGLTIGNDWAISGLDLSTDMTLAKLQGAVSSDSVNMTEQQRQLFESKELFGLAYDMNVVYSMMGETKQATAHILGVADVDDLTFGVVPTGIDVEEDEIIFNQEEETTAIAEFSITQEVQNGKGIFVSGDFNNWGVSTDYRLGWHEGNVWSNSFELELGQHEYKFVIADYETGANADYDSLNAQNRTINVVA